MSVNNESLLLDLPNDPRTLVLGMRWSPLVGSHIARLARARARQARATHYIYGGLHGASVGCIHLRKRPRGRKLYSAAQCYAHAHPTGLAAAILTLDNGQSWLIGVQDGAVITRTDRIYENPELAHQALEALCQSIPAFALLSKTHSIGTLLTYQQLIEWLNEKGELIQLGSVWNQLSRPVQNLFIFILLLVILPPTWQMWQRKQQPIKLAKRLSISSQTAWQQAINSFLNQIDIYSDTDIQKIFSDLRQLPLNIHGWALRSALCKAKQKIWTCSAAYIRMGRNASNRHFAEALPQDRTILFKSLDEAALNWQISTSPIHLNFHTLNRTKGVDLELTSFLQNILPAFTHIALTEPLPTKMRPPADEQGKPIASSFQTPLLKQRRINLQGPLRSFSLFQHPDSIISWSEITLRLSLERRLGPKLSALTASMKGTLYEKN